MYPTAGVPSSGDELTCVSLCVSGLLGSGGHSRPSSMSLPQWHARFHSLTLSIFTCSLHIPFLKRLSVSLGGWISAPATPQAQTRPFHHSTPLQGFRAAQSHPVPLCEVCWRMSYASWVLWLSLPAGPGASDSPAGPFVTCSFPFFCSCLPKWPDT